MSFAPSFPLADNTTYTATIKSTVKDMHGIGLQGNKVWTFSTGIMVIPTVILTDPLNLATGVVLNKTVSATFSEAMNSASLTATSFTLHQGANLITGVVSYTGTTAFFNPSVDLSENTIYTATITTGAESATGNKLASNYVWDIHNYEHRTSYYSYRSI
jgi:hypothetical protein